MDISKFKSNAVETLNNKKKRNKEKLPLGSDKTPSHGITK